MTAEEKTDGDNKERTTMNRGAPRVFGTWFQILRALLCIQRCQTIHNQASSHHKYFFQKEKIQTVMLELLPLLSYCRPKILLLTNALSDGTSPHLTSSPVSIPDSIGR